MATIAEDVLLLTNTDDSSDEFDEHSGVISTVVSGCLVAEALLVGAVDLREGRQFTAGTDRAAIDPIDPLVEWAGRNVLALRPDERTLTDDQQWIVEITGAVPASNDIMTRLRHSGAIRTEERKKFGRKPRQVAVSTDSAIGALGNRLRAVMVDGQAPTPHVAVTLLMLAVCSVTPALSRSEQRRWDARAERLFTPWYWQGDDGTPAEPVAGIDDSRRRMLGDFVVSFGAAYWGLHAIPYVR